MGIKTQLKSMIKKRQVWKNEHFSDWYLEVNSRKKGEWMIKFSRVALF